MVNITTCEVCGRVIPATEHGCAYCERERRRADRADAPYLPLALRLLLVVLLLDAVAVVVIAAGSLWRAAQAPDGAVGWSVVLAGVRILLASGCAVGVLLRRPLGRWLCLGFVAGEALGLAGTLLNLLPDGAWVGAPFEPLWTCLFFFLLLRADVIRRFDPPAADRRELHSLMRMVERGQRR